MEDESLRKLVHFMLLKDFPNLEEMPSTDASLPPIMLTKRFSQSMGMIMMARRMVIYCRYGGFVDKFYIRMFTSHEMYLRYVMFVLQKELQCNEDIFDNFLNVCAVLFIMCTNAFITTGMNFWNLNLDIFMVFYQGMMHKRFKKAGGLQKFAKFILDHMYHKTIDPRQLKQVDELFNDGTTGLQDTLKKKGFEFEVEHATIEDDTPSLCLATKVLSKTKATLPTLLTKRELIEKVVADNQSKMEKEAEGKPKKEAEGKPKKKAEEKPKKDEGKPKKETEGKPKKETEGKPKKETEGKPKKETDGKPKKETEGKPKKETEGKPKKETEGKHKKETEGKPKKETEGKPKKETEGKPKEETEGKPKEEAEGKPKKETANKFDYSKEVLEKPVTFNEGSRTIQTGESKAYQVDNEDISKFIMKYKSDKKIGNETEQKENRKQNEGIVQSIMRCSSNTDSNTNYEAEQKKDEVERQNFEAAIMSHSNSDSTTNSEADQKEDNVDKKGIVEAAVVFKSNLELETNYEADQKENNSKNDVIIQKIMAYNRSENASLVKSDMLKKVAEIFRHLKNCIQSLIQFLDEYDEE